MIRESMVRKTALVALLIAILSALLFMPGALANETAEKTKDKQLRPGGKGDYVVWFQNRLKTLGYYDGKLSKAYNASTAKAAKDFQLANKLKQTGRGDKTTRDTAFDKKAVTRRQYEKDNFILELKPGATGEQVEQYQGRLVHYGYLAEATGNFDGETKLATKFFQAAHKFKVDGIATTALRERINKDSGVVGYADYALVQGRTGFTAKKGVFGLNVLQVQMRLEQLGYYKGAIDATYSSALGDAVITFKKFNNFAKAAATVTKSDRAALDSMDALTYDEVYGPDTIKPGSKGKAVLEAQIILRELKFYKGSLNSEYGSSMTSAVKNFQRAKKLYPTGWLYSTSMELLEKYSVELSSEVDSRGLVAADMALAQVGKKYKARAAGPDAFDCSGLSRYVYKRVSITLAQSASAQSKRGSLITAKEDILPGDLLFFATGSNKGKLNHVGVVYSIEDGNVRFVHASSSAKKVIKSAFKDDGNADFYQKRFLFGRRMW